MRLNKYLFLILLFTSLTGFSQIEGKLERIEQLVNETIESENIPAVSMGIVSNGSEVHYLNFGHFDRTKQQEVNENSIYQIGSLSKTFVGLVLQNLILEKVVDKDSSIASFLPFEVSKRRMRKLQKITVEDVLHHHSGFARDARAGYKRKDGDPFEYNYTLEDMHKDILKLRIRSKKEYRYSNFGYALLAYIAELASGKTYPELLETYVYEPYALQSTTFDLTPSQKDSLVTPYRKDDRSIETKPWTMGKLCPPSALYSNTKDLTTLMMTQINAYITYENGNAINPAVLSNNKREVVEGSGVCYGYGCFDYWGKTIGHGGDIDGFSADYSFHPEQKCGVVLLTSSGGKWITPLIMKINKILLE
jgi:D-alanyl-D-alanine carboxypeptidase